MDNKKNFNFAEPDFDGIDDLPEEIVEQKTERGEILKEYLDFEGDIKMCSVETQKAYRALREDNLNIIDFYDINGGDKYLEAIKLVKGDFRKREDAIRKAYDILDKIGKENVVEYFQLADVHDEYPGILSRKSMDIKEGIFDFIESLNLDEVLEFLEKIQALSITSDIVSNIKKEKKAKEKKNERRHSKKEKTEVSLYLKGKLRFVQRAAQYIGQKKFTNQNSLNNLNLDELKELRNWVKRIELVIDEYGIDEYELNNNWDDVREELDSRFGDLN